MTNVEVWLGNHPALVTLILWPTITAAVNLGWKDASAYADTHPRFAPFKKLIQKIGLSPRGILDLLVRIAKGRGLPPPPAPPSGDVSILIDALQPDDTQPVITPSIPPKGNS